MLEEYKISANHYYYDTMDIAGKLCALANIDDQDVIAECEEAIYHLYATAQNQYNRDCFRVLYNVLQELAGMEVE